MDSREDFGETSNPTLHPGLLDFLKSGMYIYRRRILGRAEIPGSRPKPGQEL